MLSSGRNLFRKSFCSHRRLAFTADIDIAWSDSSVAAARDLWAQPTAFGNELLTGLPELPDSPAINDWVEHCLEVAQPQSAYADGIKD